jgi:hypothetical protein
MGQITQIPKKGLIGNMIKLNFVVCSSESKLKFHIDERLDMQSRRNEWIDR